jgi:hypothetical protein
MSLYRCPHLLGVRGRYNNQGRYWRPDGSYHPCVGAIRYPRGPEWRKGCKGHGSPDAPSALSHAPPHPDSCWPEIPSGPGVPSLPSGVRSCRVPGNGPWWKRWWQSVGSGLSGVVQRDMHPSPRRGRRCGGRRPRGSVRVPASRLAYQIPSWHWDSPVCGSPQSPQVSKGGGAGGRAAPSSARTSRTGSSGVSVAFGSAIDDCQLIVTIGGGK